MRLIASIIFLFLFWNELNKDHTAIAFLCLIIGIAFLMWEFFAVWLDLAVLIA